MWPSATFPRSASSTPARMRSSVVLPAPLSPMMISRSPRSTATSTSTNTTLSPNALPSPRPLRAVRPDGSGWGKRTVTLRARPPTSTRFSLSLATRGLPGAGPLRHLLGGPLEAADPLLQPGDVLVLVTALSEALLAARLALGQVVAVGAAVRLDRPLVHRQHRRDRRVEQVQVVADHQQPPSVGAEELHQPRLGVEVEVVGRLVEQQGVGLGEQDPGQLDAAPLPARHGDAPVGRARRRRCPARRRTVSPRRWRRSRRRR